jgi:hypothetical protein
MVDGVAKVRARCQSPWSSASRPRVGPPVRPHAFARTPPRLTPLARNAAMSHAVANSESPGPSANAAPTWVPSWPIAMCRPGQPALAVHRRHPLLDVPG